jgi:hypothetical protein
MACDAYVVQTIFGDYGRPALMVQGRRVLLVDDLWGDWYYAGYSPSFIQHTSLKSNLPRLLSSNSQSADHLGWNASSGAFIASNNAALLGNLLMPLLLEAPQVAVEGFRIDNFEFHRTLSGIARGEDRFAAILTLLRLARTQRGSPIRPSEGEILTDSAGQPGVSRFAATAR